MSPANDPPSNGAPEQQPPPSPDENASVPDADKAEPAPHERPVRTDDN
ncbi:hypothetical protein [Caballeronia sp. LZ016]|nr:hypothetical protein [Caballeronia sp. LZ016]MDR5736375.1 hypothetical protein [Caballeronia sp. LZ016]